MKTTMKIKTLFIAAAACAVTGVVAINNTAANAEETPRFYMEAGAAVNLEEGYGGIRWTTVVEAGYNASAANVTYGTFVLPTATYEAEKASKAVAEMTGVVDIPSEVDPSANEGNTKYYSAIKYDDIVEDYKAANAGVAVNETELLTKAYQMELTAISYALIGNEYTYAEVVETSRSARQVANMAELDGKLKNASAEKKAQITAYITTGATSFVREESDEEGYLDLTELAQTTPVAQNITVSAKMAELDWTANVKEVLVGANKVDYTYADGVLTLSEGTATAVAGEETYLSVFDNSGNVYNMIIVPADGVISTVKEFFDTFGVDSKQTYDKCQVCAAAIKSCTCANGATEWNDIVKTQTGYYVLANDLDGATEYYEGTTTYKATQISAGSGFGSNGTAMYERIQGGMRNATLDGRGHSINNIKIAASGIFGLIFDSTIKNIALQDIVVPVSQSSTLLFAQHIFNSTFENVYIEMQAGHGGFGLGAYCENNTFTNFVAVYSFSQAPTASRAVSVFGKNQKTFNCVDANGYYDLGGTTYNNVYIISQYILGQIKADYHIDAENWGTPTTGTNNYTEAGIKRYTSMADMMANKYYNANGSENTSATKTENDWTKFDSKYWTVTNEGISWN